MNKYDKKKYDKKYDKKYYISVSCKKDGLRHRVSRSCCWQTSAELQPAAAAWPGMPEMPGPRTRNGGDPGLQLWSERRTVHQGRVKHLGLSRKMLAENGGMGTSMSSVCTSQREPSTRNHGIQWDSKQRPWHSWCSQRLSESL